MKKYGSRSEVYNGEAEATRGGLTKADLILSKTGKIVSKKKSEAALAAYKKYGFTKRLPAKAAEPAPQEPKRKRRKRKKKVDE